MPPLGLHGPSASLKPSGGSLIMGYHSGGWHPFVPPLLQIGKTMHVGFLKLFLFTQPLELLLQQCSSISQYKPSMHSTTSTWDTIVIPVVQWLHRPIDYGVTNKPEIGKHHISTQSQVHLVPLAGR